MFKDIDLTIFKNTILIIGVLFAFYLAFILKDFLLLLFAAFILASSIEPVVKLFSKKMSRNKAIVLVLLIGLFAIFILLVPFLNILIKQMILFFKDIPEYWDKVVSLFQQVKTEGLYSILKTFQLEGLAEKIDTNVLPDTTKIIGSLSEIAQKVIENSILLTQGFSNFLISVFTTLVIVIIFLKDKNYLRDKFLTLFPSHKRKKVSEISSTISSKVGGYVISQLFASLFIGLFTTIGFAIVQIKFSLILGTIAGVSDIVPIVGPTIATIIIALVIFAQKPILVIPGILLFLIAQWLSDNVVKPILMSKFLDLHSLTIISSLVIGGLFFGTIGLVLAPAMAASLCVLVDELYIKTLD